MTKMQNGKQTHKNRQSQLLEKLHFTNVACFSSTQLLIILALFMTSSHALEACQTRYYALCSKLAFGFVHAGCVIARTKVDKYSSQLNMLYMYKIA